MKKAFIIHRWEGNPQGDWYPWLKKKLESINFKVEIPKMPNPDEPNINAWTSLLKKKVITPNQETFFIGHSIGCQTILRYLENLSSNAKIGGVVFVAGWVHLTPEAIEDEKAEQIAKPWLETSIDWKKVKSHCNNFVVIFSDNDLFVPTEDAEIFKKNLMAKIVIEKGKGHFSEGDGITRVPSVLKAINDMLK